MQEYLEIGQIVNTYGIKGYLKVTTFTDDVKRFENLKKIYVVKNGKNVEFEITDVIYIKSNLIALKFKGIEDINEAEKYKGCFLKINRKDAIELEENRYFIVDLIGMDVFTEAEEYVGKLEDIFPTGSNDVYVVRQENGKQILLPALQSVIKKVDIESKKMTVNLNQGVIV